ncbi:transposable element Tcb1 transposase [Trichonephila clavipes]|nr:transposable element Tcb1 transposase [Trichonephila clavipes]
MLPLTPPTDASVWSVVAHEETGLQRSGISLSLATNPDSMSAVRTIVFVCGDPVVNAPKPFLCFTTTHRVIKWGVIASNTRPSLVLIRGTMTAQRYVHDILQPHVLPLMHRIPGAISQQGNAWLHTAMVSQDNLRTVTIFLWPVRSPDLSPIEHIWDHLGRRVGHLRSLDELEARLQQIWNEMSPDIIQNLYASMPERIASCIRARGGATDITSSVLLLFSEKNDLLSLIF